MPATIPRAKPCSEDEWRTATVMMKARRAFLPGKSGIAPTELNGRLDKTLVQSRMPDDGSRRGSGGQGLLMKRLFRPQNEPPSHAMCRPLGDCADLSESSGGSGSSVQLGSFNLPLANVPSETQSSVGSDSEDDAPAAPSPLRFRRPSALPSHRPDALLTNDSLENPPSEAPPSTVGSPSRLSRKTTDLSSRDFTRLATPTSVATSAASSSSSRRRQRSSVAHVIQAWSYPTLETPDSHMTATECTLKYRPAPSAARRSSAV